MTDDLKARLRDEHLPMTRSEAADRIEQLERERDILAARCDSRNHERLEALSHNASQAMKISQGIVALIQSRAETAASYEQAARVAEKERAVWDAGYNTTTSGYAVCEATAKIREEIRALTTPDQTAALDRLIAEAEARVWKEAEKLVRPTRGKSGNGIVVAALHRVADALLEASKKGGA